LNKAQEINLVKRLTSAKTKKEEKKTKTREDGYSRITEGEDEEG
jgi:hypothetical protein